METRIIEIELTEGSVWRVFCQGSNQINRFNIAANKLNAKRIEVISKGIHDVAQFEQIASTLENESIKKWYCSFFPTDELGEEISEEATFEGVQINLGIVYDYLNVHDSIVRERVFEELSSRLGVPYKYIYDKWLNIEQETLNA
jgi:hypothetical protein